MTNVTPHNLDFLEQVVGQDVVALKKAFKNYGDSWKARGGVGAFMMLARKWDRLENFVKNLSERFRAKGGASDYDIFRAIREDRRPEGIMDDIRDLRRYLILVEAHMMAEGVVTPEVIKDVVAGDREAVLPLTRDAGGQLAFKPGIMGESGAEAVRPLSPSGSAQPHPRGFDPAVDGSKAPGEPGPGYVNQG